MTRRLYTEILFWFHVLLILASIAAGYFLPPLYVALLIVIHEIHVRVFHGCILTQYEKSLHGLPKNADFFQYAIKRLFNMKVSKAAARRVNYGILLICLLLSIYRFGLGII